MDPSQRSYLQLHRTTCHHLHRSESGLQPYRSILRCTQISNKGKIIQTPECVPAAVFTPNTSNRPENKEVSLWSDALTGSERHRIANIIMSPCEKSEFTDRQVCRSDDELTTSQMLVPWMEFGSIRAEIYFRKFPGSLTVSLTSLQDRSSFVLCQ